MFIEIPSIVIAFFVAGLSAMCLFPLFMWVALRYDIVDKPDNQLKQHEAPTPYLGGAALFLSWFVGVAFTGFLAPLSLGLVIGLCATSALGLWDDLYTLSPGRKFVGLSFIAAFFLHHGVYLKTLWIPFWATLPLSFLWLVTMMNAFNLIDIMDGLCGVTALGAAIGFGGVAWYLGQWSLLVILASLVGALYVFLLHNKPPAQIYLGDSGSLFLGGFFATVPLLFDFGSVWSPHSYGFLVIPVICAIPLGEVLILIVIRRWKGIPFYRGSRHHFAHFLQGRGFSPWRILLSVFLLSCLLLVLSLLFLAKLVSLLQWIALGAICALCWLVFVYYLP